MPLIGITSTGRSDRFLESKYYNHFYAVPSLYVDAVQRAGGSAILLPPPTETTKDYINRILAMVDGVIISGGGDIDPQQYGGNREHPAVSGCDTERDTYEIALTRALAERNDIPTLCVCRGMQVLNVAMGGTMTEHIPDIQETDIHRDKGGLWTQHDIQVEAESQLAAIMGADCVTTFSGHHQAVKQIGEGLRVTASAPDGIIEGLQLYGHPWFVGVQWHPEKSAADDVTQQRLFDALVKQAASRA